MDSVVDRELSIILTDVLKLQQATAKRRIFHVHKWASELFCSIVNSPLVSTMIQQGWDPSDLLTTTTGCDPESAELTCTEAAITTLCQSCIDNREFERAVKLSQNCVNADLLFIHCHALYLSGEKKKVESSADVCGTKGNGLQFDLNQKCGAIVKRLKSNIDELYHNDSWLNYIYAIALRDENMKEEAIAYMCRSIRSKPLFWGAWAELSQLISDREQLDKLDLPDHWLRSFFLGEINIRLHFATEALRILSPLQESPQSPFRNWPYLLERLAAAYHSRTPQGLDEIIEIFEQIQLIDPYRLDGIDLYANTLFVKGLRVELANLAHRLFEDNKYTVETCCVVGNYFSLRGEHERAITYFQRALKLNPKHGGVWVLIGHEFMELQNHAGATKAYRKAIEVDPSDVRAWYGLGQGYEIAKMPSWALFYYRQAHKLRPADSRFLVAMGNVYEDLGQLEEAAKACWKAHSVGDIEGMALIKLGRIHETMKKSDQAASVYSLFLERLHEQKLSDEINEPECYRFLASYCLEVGRLEEAHSYAQKCLEFEKTKEEAKGILKKLSQLRSEKGDPTVDSGQNVHVL